MECADLTPKKELPGKTQRTGIEFLIRELEIGITFANLAIAEQGYGEQEDGQQARQNAMKAYASFIRFLPTVEDQMNIAERREIQGKRVELENLIAGFQK